VEGVCGVVGEGMGGVKAEMTVGMLFIDTGDIDCGGLAWECDMTTGWGPCEGGIAPINEEGGCWCVVIRTGGEEVE
jgi:hypothetical protein